MPVFLYAFGRARRDELPFFSKPQRQPCKNPWLTVRWYYTMPDSTAPTARFMRSEARMMDLVLSFAREDQRVRLVGMEGSRLDPDAPEDRFRDYDITYIVTDIGSFIADDAWLDYFGRRIIMQKPEAMSLFPPELGGWFSYLMLFTDGNRLDLKLVPLEELQKYLTSESRLTILLDKDGMLPGPVTPSNRDFVVHPPAAAQFDDCCNEFWWVATYVAKGLCRGEFLYAADHLDSYVRPSLLRMLSWEATACRPPGTVVPGKSYKYLFRYAPADTMRQVELSFRNASIAELWDALFLCLELFRRSSKKTGAMLGYPYPDYDENVSAYLSSLRDEFSTGRAGNSG